MDGGMAFKADRGLLQRASSRLLKAYVPASGCLRHSSLGLTLGIAAFGAAFALRTVLHPLLPTGFPFVTFYPAVILSSYLGGARVGLLCATLSGFAAWGRFFPEAFSLSNSALTVLALFTLVVMVNILLFHLMQQATDRLVAAEGQTRSLLDQQRRLTDDLRRETRSREVHQTLAEKSLFLDLALKAAQAGTWHFCVATGRARLSAEMARQHGLGDQEIEIDVERDWRPLVHPDDADRTLADLSGAIAEGGNFETDYRIVLRDGQTRWVSGLGRVEVDEWGEAVSVIGLTFDVTARKLAEQHIEHLARHDSLTGLANRTQFRERLMQEFARAQPGGSFALLCLDLDRFKAVNDTLGHAAGDALLSAVANRMTSVVAVGDMVARLGGDEFVVILPGVSRLVDAAALAQDLARAIERPLMIEGCEVGIGASIGIALAPQDGDTPDALYRSADRALYRAKAEGRGTWRNAA